MSNSDIKPIKINPELFNMKTKGAKNKTFKNTKSSSHLRPNNLKKELITKIKNYRHNKYPDKSDLEQNIKIEKPSVIDAQINDHAPSITKIPSKHIPFNMNTKSQKSINSVSNISLDDDDFSQSVNFLRELSSKNKKKPKKSTEDFPISLGEAESKDSSQNPPYSCLKNSTLPTYREWKNKTIKNTGQSSNYDTDEDVGNYNTPSIQDLGENNIENPPVRSNNLGKKKTTTLKYYLGKRGRKVAILIKNSATRKKINDEHSLLKQTNITDMKNYLKRHNLLKSGSHAPPEIIKKLYEQSLLGGDIRNSNKNNIIHNYLTK